ncbi:dihydropteroate synthase [Chachezhania sediminis]|uniref:dihydropteroate synthase n=1 Tax=Chachezhania sediminis TaxID=2599291 RepID=UPI00131A922E|nr:dihydropteroate synthase [Chachezhania sediminis]
MTCFRPIPTPDAALATAGARPLAGLPLTFTHAERLDRGGARPGPLVPAGDLPVDLLDRLTAPRVPVAGIAMDAPAIMGVLNVTPDSFSDGGRFIDPEVAVAQALAMQEAGAAIVDIGGESTRPGSAEVPMEEEIARTAPVIAALRHAAPGLPISIDTRKAAVAEAAIGAGATLVNDVSGFAFDPALAPLCAEAGVAVCTMHSQGTPDVMQANPTYDDVLLDIYDALAAQVDRLGSHGIPPERILADPGIGFGKTIAHNCALVRGIALFHGLGCPLLLGVSRKGFIGKIGLEPVADRRAPGSIAVALAGIAQGVQVVRVHDVAETAQAIRLWAAVR